MTEGQAGEWLAGHGLKPRVVVREGSHMTITRDVVINRVNLHLDNGVVTKVYPG